MKRKKLVIMIFGFILFFAGWAYKRYDNNDYFWGVSLISVGLVIIGISIIRYLNNNDSV